MCVCVCLQVVSSIPTKPRIVFIIIQMEAFRIQILPVFCIQEWFPRILIESCINWLYFCVEIDFRNYTLFTNIRLVFLIQNWTLRLCL